MEAVLPEKLANFVRSLHAVSPLPAGSFLAIAASSCPARPRSRFENMALLSGEPSRHGGAALAVLLAAVPPRKQSEPSVLQPLWAEEAMHRAYGLMRLVANQTDRNDSADRTSPLTGWERRLAQDLAAHFRGLETGDERQVRPCSDVLRAVVADLCALFGGAANIGLRTNIERMALPQYKRRALVLAAAELVTNAILHGFPTRSGGQIEVSLTSFGAAHACLRVADDGVGFTEKLPNLHCGIAAGLAELMEADLTYDRRNGWTAAEIAFPVRPEVRSARPHAARKSMSTIAPDHLPRRWVVE
jgi:two-component sensor histidine kinase